MCSGTREHTPVRTHTKGLFTLRLTPGKDTFHTCNLKAVLAPHFTRGYETLLRSRVSTAFVVLSPHCGAKFVQCETSGVACCRVNAASEKKYQKMERVNRRRY